MTSPRITASSAHAAGDGPPRDSARGAIVAGITIILVFFGAFGGWAITAPLNGAIVGNAVVKVEGNRKSVQHLDGGIVKELRVHEGDHVTAGDVLLTLDDTDIRARVDVLSRQYTLLKATEARLTAELDGSTTIDFPPELTGRADDPSVQAAMSGQEEEFASRRTALDGQKQVLTQRVDQLEESITGSEGQKTAYEQQLASVIDEKKSLRDLLDQGLIARPRVLQLERTESGLRGQIAQAEADIAKAKKAIEENRNQIAQLTKDRMAKIAADLGDTRAKLLDVGPRLESARKSLQRTVVRVPYTGTVVGLNVFSVGAVIKPGDRILDIVPDGTDLVVEAQIAVDDIADLRPGMAAEVHFTAYKQRLTPLIHGTVTEISADRLTDPRTGAAYYAAVVGIDQQDLAATPEISLHPGMPATVMITTEKRTAFEYLVGPLFASLDRSFRQK
jgi:HlyD family type I secretion membrane fusion protein